LRDDDGRRDANDHANDENEFVPNDRRACAIQRPRKTTCYKKIMSTTSSYDALDNKDLLDVTKRLASAERHATAALLRALMEVDARRLYLGEGCASMFTWCTQVLHMAEGAAYNRIETARAARKYRVILGLFEESSVSLTAIRLLAPHLTDENHAALLAAARHKSKREIEKLVAALRPKPDAPTLVRRVAAPTACPSRRPDSGSCPPSDIAHTFATSTSSPNIAEDTTVPRPQARATKPLASDRYRMQFTISRETHDRFRRAQELLRHAVPSGDAAEVLDRALILLVDHLERQRFAQISRPRTSQSPESGTRHIPAAVRREVWRRDGGRCAFIGTSGRCRETAFLEFHHVTPYAVGGEATADNVQLRCRAHNAYEAWLFFGESVVRENRPQRRAFAGDGLDVEAHASTASGWTGPLVIPRRSGRKARSSPGPAGRPIVPA
jgi:5-methylcytosine-specific restriction endonuclease McrA